MDQRNYSTVNAAVTDAEDVDACVGVEGELGATAGRHIDGVRLEGGDPVVLRRRLLRIASNGQGHVLALATRMLRRDRTGPIRVIRRRRRSLARPDVPPRGGSEAAERLGSRRRVDEDLPLVAIFVEVGGVREGRARAGAVAVG